MPDTAPPRRKAARCLSQSGRRSGSREIYFILPKFHCRKDRRLVARSFRCRGSTAVPKLSLRRFSAPDRHRFAGDPAIVDRGPALCDCAVPRLLPYDPERRRACVEHVVGHPARQTHSRWPACRAVSRSTPVATTKNVPSGGKAELSPWAPRERNQPGRRVLYRDPCRRRGKGSTSEGCEERRPQTPPRRIARRGRRRSRSRSRARSPDWWRRAEGPATARGPRPWQRASVSWRVRRRSRNRRRPRRRPRARRSSPPIFRIRARGTKNGASTTRDGPAPRPVGRPEEPG